MKTTSITSEFIFSNGSVLTMAAASGLIGKRIAATSCEYHGNHKHVRIFNVKGFDSEWDIAAREECPGYANRQEYWASYMTLNQIQDRKDSILLLTEYSDNEYWCNVGMRCDLSSKYHSEPVFYGSDIDRLVYFVELSNAN